MSEELEDDAAKHPSGKAAVSASASASVTTTAAKYEFVLGDEKYLSLLWSALYLWANIENFMPFFLGSLIGCDDAKSIKIYHSIINPQRTFERPFEKLALPRQAMERSGPGGGSGGE